MKNGAEIEMECERAAEIQEQLTGKAPTCEAGKTYDGCATECSYITCEMAVKNDLNFEPTDKCEDNGFSDKLFLKIIIFRKFSPSFKIASFFFLNLAAPGCNIFVTNIL